MTKSTFPKYRHPLHSGLWMYKRERSPFWWCGLHHKGKYHRTSTKSKYQAESEDFAADWYLDQLVEIRSGKSPATKKSKDTHTVKNASIYAIKSYRVLVDRGDKSPEYLKSIIRVLNKHIVPYFGNMSVEDINAAIWKKFIKYLYKTYPTIANNTVHQIRNALAVCMNAAADEDWIKESPRLRLASQTNIPTKRVWFEPEEQKKLLIALDDYVKQMALTPHKKDALELRDYAKFILYSGLRVGEASHLRFCDVREFVDERSIPHIIISIDMGKRGTGTCNPDRKIMKVYNSIKQRRQSLDDKETLFERHHRDSFNIVLTSVNLKKEKSGKKRDFISLRHTYISNKIREKVPIYEIAHNCRTSPTMINKHYAWHMGPEFFTSLHVKEDADIDRRIASIGNKEKELEILKNDMTDSMKELAEFISTDTNSEKSEFLKKLSADGFPILATPDITTGHSIKVKLPVGEQEKEIAASIKQIMDVYGLTFEQLKQLTSTDSK